MNKPKMKDEDILRNLESSFEEVFSKDKGAKTSLLKDMGHDPDKLIANGLEHINRLVAQQKLTLMGELRKKVLSKLPGISGKYNNLPGEQIRLLFEQAFSSDNTAPQTAFRDLKEVCDDDLRIILEDKEILDEWKNLSEIE